MRHAETCASAYVMPLRSALCIPSLLLAYLVLDSCTGCDHVPGRVASLTIGSGTENIRTCGDSLVAISHKGAIVSWDWSDLMIPPREVATACGAPLALVGANQVATSLLRDGDASHVVIVQSLRGDQVISRWVLGAEFYCQGIRASANGRHLAIWAGEDFVVTHNPSHPRVRLGTATPQSKEIGWVADVREENATLMIAGAAASEDGRLIAAAGLNNGGWVLVADVAEKRILWQRVILGAVKFNDVAFLPEADVVYAGGGSGELYAFGSKTGLVQRTWSVGDGKGGAWSHRITRVAVSPDGRTVAAGTGPGGEVYLWDTKTGGRLGVPKTTEATTTGLAFSPDSSRLATAGVGNRKIEIWRIPRD